MSDFPCDDLHCECCHPEEQHSCDGPPWGTTEPYTCPECAVTWTHHDERPPHWPDAMADPPHGWWEADQPVPTKSEIAARAAT